MKRPDIENTLIAVAYLMADHSTCSRGKVGAIVAKEHRIITTGYNGAPAGMPHCLHPPDEPRNMACTNAVHAEANAVAFAARHGLVVDGATLYTTTTPCIACAQLIINAGISRVVAHVAYRDGGGRVLLLDAGVEFEMLGDPSGT